MERMMDILNNGLEKLITKQINQALGKEDNTAGSDGGNKKYPTRQANAEKKRENGVDRHIQRDNTTNDQLPRKPVDDSLKEEGNHRNGSK